MLNVYVSLEIYCITSPLCMHHRMALEMDLLEHSVDSHFQPLETSANNSARNEWAKRIENRNEKDAKRSICSTKCSTILGKYDSFVDLFDNVEICSSKRPQSTCLPWPSSQRQTNVHTIAWSNDTKADILISKDHQTKPYKRTINNGYIKYPWPK